MPLTLFRRGKTRTFYYRGTIGPSGRRKFFYGSCHTTEKDIAARQVAEIEKRYWDGHFNGPETILTFARAAQIYRAAGKADRFLNPIEKYLGPKFVKDITESTIQLMAKELFPNCSGASLNRLAIVPTMAVINHAARSKLCSRLIIEWYKSETKIKEPATLDWVKAFCAEAEPHLGAWVLFMYLTGARPEEGISLQWDDVDLTAQTALIRESKVGKERKAHLPTPLVVALANLERVKDRGVFVYTHPNASRHAWAGVIKRTGIKRLTPHCCRHGFATGLLRRGVDVVTVAWLGGWKSAAQVLKTYGHANKNPKLTDLLVGGEFNQFEQIENQRKII